jgi:hypothetical protein
MKTTTRLLPLLLLLLTPARLRAQSLDAATDARVDAAPVVDAASDAASGAAGAGGSGGPKDGGARDAAPPPPITFFLNESPGCALGGAADPDGGALFGVALAGWALGRRRGNAGRAARV